jgi:ABC-type lipoprotein export system ATPase subunit
MSNPAEPKAFAISFLSFSGDPMDLSLKVGQVLFIVGANGTGKSSLLQRINQQHRDSCHRILAHRQTWFESNELNLTPTSKKQLESNIASRDVQIVSRWTDPVGVARSSLAIYNLVESENVLARKVTQHVREKSFSEAEHLARRLSPIQEINAIFAISNIPVTLHIQESDSQVLAKRNGGSEYSVAKLSDGERNALLIAAEILTAKPESLIIVDEPERHLHRSIISPLLTSLFEKRRDCAFVISTHEVMLPIDQPQSRRLLLRGYRHSDGNDSRWDADLIEPNPATKGTLDERVTADLLGARRRVIFVEGTGASLDKSIYGILFPEASVVAAGNCRDVERAVLGIRDSAEHHWVRAYGIVDSDSRPQADLDRLKARGVYAVPFYSVESLYYHPWIQGRVSKRRQEALGGDSVVDLARAKAALIKEASAQADRFAQASADRRVREEVLGKIPKGSNFSSTLPINIEINVGEHLAKAKAELDAMIVANQDCKILCSYPMRESGALATVAKELRFQGRSDYEEAVRKLLTDVQEARDFLTGLFGSLAADIRAD